MARKRQRPKQRTTWHRQLTLPQMLDLLSGWKPPENEFDIERAKRGGFLTIGDVEAAWEAHCDDEFFTRHIRERCVDPNRFRPGRRAWAWWQFDAPGKIRDGETEAQALERLGLLSDEERKELAEAK